MGVHLMMSGDQWCGRQSSWFCYDERGCTVILCRLRAGVCMCGAGLLLPRGTRPHVVRNFLEIVQCHRSSVCVAWRDVAWRENASGGEARRHTEDCGVGSMARVHDVSRGVIRPLQALLRCFAVFTTLPCLSRRERPLERIAVGVMRSRGPSPPGIGDGRESTVVGRGRCLPCMYRCTTVLLYVGLESTCKTN